MDNVPIVLKVLSEVLWLNETIDDIGGPNKHKSILVLPNQLVEEKTLDTNRDDKLEATKNVWI